jgi:hypothetical protein
MLVQHPRKFVPIRVPANPYFASLVVLPVSSQGRSSSNNDGIIQQFEELEKTRVAILSPVRLPVPPPRHIAASIARMKTYCLGQRAMKKGFNP